MQEPTNDPGDGAGTMPNPNPWKMCIWLTVFMITEELADWLGKK
jgi:hypothetical protein